MCWTMSDSNCTWSVSALTLKRRACCARVSLPTDARRLASSLLMRVRGGSTEGLAGFGGKGAVMIENLGLVRAETFSLVGEKIFTAIGANGKWQAPALQRMRQP